MIILFHLFSTTFNISMVGNKLFWPHLVVEKYEVTVSFEHFMQIPIAWDFFLGKYGHKSLSLNPNKVTWLNGRWTIFHRKVTFFWKVCLLNL